MSFRDRLGLSVPQAVVAWGLVALIGGLQPSCDAHM